MKRRLNSRAQMNTSRSILFVIFGLLLVIQVAICAAGARLGSDGRSDFRQLYTAGYMVRTGHAAQSYDYDIEIDYQERVVGPGDPLPFDHIAYEAVFFAPLSLFRFQTAYFIFFAINLGLLGLAIWLFTPYLAVLKTWAPWMPYAVFLCFVPVSISLILGQDSILLLTLMIAAFVALNRRSEVQSGILLGLGLFKFQYVIPIALLFFVWRKWRIVLGMVLSGSALALLSLWMVGLSAARAFGRTLFDLSVGLASNAARTKYGTFPDRMPNLRGLIYALAEHSSITQVKVAAVIVICSAIVFVMAAKMRPSFSLAVVAATLLSYHSLIPDSVLLIIPIGLTLQSSLQAKKAAVAAIALIVFVLPAILFQFWDGLYCVMAIPVLGLMWACKAMEGEVGSPG